jgi:hypothetical protein
MALLKCQDCGGPVSDRAAACPKCGAPVGAQGAKARAKAAPQMGPVRRAIRWAGMALVSVVVFSCVFEMAKPSEPAAPRAFGNADAVALCRDAIRAHSRDPERAEVPYVEGLARGDEILLAWNGGTRMLRLRNGLGLEVASTGSCVVSVSGKRVTLLTIDGKTVI